MSSSKGYNKESDDVNNSEATQQQRRVLEGVLSPTGANEQRRVSDPTSNFSETSNLNESFPRQEEPQPGSKRGGGGGGSSSNCLDGHELRQEEQQQQQQHAHQHHHVSAVDNATVRQQGDLVSVHLEATMNGSDHFSPTHFKHNVFSPMYREHDIVWDPKDVQLPPAVLAAMAAQQQQQQENSCGQQQQQEQEKK